MMGRVKDRTRTRAVSQQRASNAPLRSEYKDAYSSLSKSAIVQSSNMFNDKVLKEKNCIDLLNKATFLLNQGQIFADNEKSQLFFNVTKLFQIPQSQRNKLYQNMRRLVYVLIKVGSI